MTLKFFLSCVLLILFYAPCKSQSKETAFKSQLDSLFSSEFDADGPGGSILVKKGNKTVYSRSFGLADLETKDKITENTIFNTGSISKTFVANGILILKERGLLSLDANLAEFFDDFEDESISKNITIKHLLSHTSGLPDLRRVRKNREFFLTAKDEENFEPLKDVARLNFEPGERFEYSNPVYNGLALIIEKLANEKWQAFIDKNIFAPSGMSMSKITDGSYPEEEVAHAYVLKNGVYTESDYGEVPTFAAAGNGGVWSTVSDLAKYQKALNESVFLSKELIKESTTIYRPENWKGRSNPKIGYSWFISSKENSKYAVAMVSHTGSQGGFNSFHQYFPEKDLLFIGLFNRPLGTSWSKMNEAIDIFHKNQWLDDSN